MATVTVTERWEVEELAECLRCGEAMVVSPHVMGIELGPGRYLCHPCYFFVFDGSRARAAEALGLEPEGPDGDGPTPAAPALAPVDLELAVSAARSARPFTHLSELSDSERAEYEAWAAEVLASAPDPEPCIACGRPAAPYQDTDAGPLCFRCWGPTGPTGPWPDRAALAALWCDVLVELRAAKQRSARVDAVLARRRS